MSSIYFAALLLFRSAVAVFLLNSQVLPQLLSFNTCVFPLPLPRNCAFPTVLLLLALARTAVLWKSPPHPRPYTDLVTNSPRDTFPRPSTGAYHLLSDHAHVKLLDLSGNNLRLFSKYTVLYISVSKSCESITYPKYLTHVSIIILKGSESREVGKHKIKKQTDWGPV